jgi:DNA-binding protein
MTDLPIAAVARIAKKNGIERVGSDAAEALVDVAEQYLAEISVETLKFAHHAHRKTIRKEDVELAVEQVRARSAKIHGFPNPAQKVRSI